MPSPQDPYRDPNDPGYTDRPPHPSDRPSNRPADRDDFDDEPRGPRLGSLAQKARGKQLNQARWILIIIGILTILINGALIPFARSMVKSQIDQELRKQNIVNVDQRKVREVEDQQVRIVMIASGIGVVLGIIFVVCGVLVYKFPVAATLVSLILYIVANLGFAALEPTSLASGLIIKIIIVVALVKAVQAAFAYEKELRYQKEAGLERG